VLERTDGEGGPVKFDEYLYELVCEPKELNLSRGRGSLRFRGAEVDGWMPVLVRNPENRPPLR
jgi:hypothetical protein